MPSLLYTRMTNCHSCVFALLLALRLVWVGALIPSASTRTQYLEFFIWRLRVFPKGGVMPEDCSVNSYSNLRTRFKQAVFSLRM